uniref:Uncharacterized protein n=1 Tax=Knufia peltigerae TaxID=1002370 RepID=A0AA38XPK6_9EURO|nr:hypothetical protein H2204_013895 [Knufia peltigerae]
MNPGWVGAAAGHDHEKGRAACEGSPAHLPGSDPVWPGSLGSGHDMAGTFKQAQSGSQHRRGPDQWPEPPYGQPGVNSQPGANPALAGVAKACAAPNDIAATTTMPAMDENSFFFPIICISFAERRGGSHRIAADQQAVGASIAVRAAGMLLATRCKAGLHRCGEGLCGTE